MLGKEKILILCNISFIFLNFKLNFSLGIYVIMALVTAVIYNQFKGFFHDSMLSSAFRQSLGIRAAFWVLYDQFKNEVNGSGLIPKSAVSCTIQNLSCSQKRRNQLMKNLNDISFCIQDTDELPINIDLEQFEKLFIDNLNDLDDENEDVMSEIFPNVSNDGEELSYFQKILTGMRRLLRIIYETKYYLWVTCLLTIINIVCITLELHWFIDENDEDKTHESLSYVIFIFSIYYFMENVLKIWSLSWKRYSQDFLHLFDCIITIGFFTTQIVHISIYGRPYLNRIETKLEDSTTSIWGISRFFNMLFIYRLIHVAPSVNIMLTLIYTIIDIIRSLRPLFGILIVFYYIYALIGMQLYSNKILLDTFNKYNQRFLLFLFKSIYYLYELT